MTERDEIMEVAVRIACDTADLHLTCSCPKCGAPMGFALTAGGCNMLCCTRCSSAEDQAAMQQADAQVARYAELSKSQPPAARSFWKRLFSR